MLPTVGRVAAICAGWRYLTRPISDTVWLGQWRSTRRFKIYYLFNDPSNRLYGGIGRVFNCILALGLITAWPTDGLATDFYVYSLGGQSHMEGYGSVDELPAKQAGSQNRVMIFHGNPAPDQSPGGGKGIWAELQPGHGYGFRSDGNRNQYSNRFGPELTFAQTIQEQFPDRRIAIIKYANGGTSIDPSAAGQFGCWEPTLEGINQYDHFLTTVRLAQSDTDIDDDGVADRLIPAGIIWLQGESDANHSPQIANRYEANLRRLIGRMRTTFGRDDLPVVIGRVSPSQLPEMFWKHLEIVRTAQAQYTQEDANAVLVETTDSYGHSDFWHYDSAGYLALGREVGAAVAKLELEKP